MDTTSTLEDNVAIIGIFMLVVIVCYAVSEAGILIVAYLNADEVECTFLWCTFTTTRTISSQDSTVISTSQISSISEVNVIRTCTMNGEPINCSDIYKGGE